VQGLPSSVGPVIGVWNIPPPIELHPSAVQTLLSLVGVAVPGTNVPLLQLSPVVHALLSSVGPVNGVWNIPPGVEQPSVVQILLSVVGVAPPGTNVPLLHLSPVVQGLPSSVGPVIGVWNIPPLPESQPSVVQILLSVVGVADPGTNTPLLQLSPVVQALPSSTGP